MKKKQRRALYYETIFSSFCLMATILPLVILIALLIDTFVKGIPRINFDFLLGLPSRFAELAGIFPSLMGSVYLMILTAIIALPLSIFAAVFLEEYAKDSWVKHLIELNVNNLAGVPSVIFGLLGLEIFVRFLGLGSSLLAAALTLSLLIMPIVITTTREALKTIPQTLREAGLALGGPRLTIIFKVVLPLAMPEIITGSILAISRAIGESAPLIVLGAATYLAFAPDHLLSEFSALPLQIFQWIQRPQQGFIDNGASTIVVLLIILSIFNLAAAYFRNYQENKRGSL